MGRKSIYKVDDGGDSKKEKITFSSVESKFGKEDMSAEEFAMLLCKVNGFVPESITSKTVKNYIKAICEKSNQKLSINEFKKDPNNTKSQYIFRKEYHSILLVLMATICFDGWHNDRKLSTRGEMHQQLVENINKYLAESDKKIIKQDPTYVNAMLEKHLTDHINQQLCSLLRTMYHSDPVLRYQFMIEFLYNLTHLRVWMEKEDIHMTSTRMVYSHELDELKDALCQKGLFESIELDEFLVNYLTLQMKNKTYEYISEEEELTPAAMYLAAKLFKIDIKDDSEIKATLDRIDRVIENESRYKKIMEKAQTILDLEDFYEKQIYIELKSLAAIKYLKPQVTPEDYNRTVRFTEAAIAKDKWDILSEFASLGRNAMSLEQIEKIMAIKDHSEYSRKMEK